MWGLLPIGAPQYRAAGALGIEAAAGGFEEPMWQEVKRSWNVVRGELTAASSCVEAWPAQNGYREDCTATDSTWDINLNTSTPQCQTSP